jgi:hypothetical protein
MPAPPVSRPKKSSQLSASKKPDRKPAIASNTSPTIAAKNGTVAPQLDAPQLEMSPPDDMFTQLESARKRRADAQTDAPAPRPAPSTHEEVQNDNSIALANIATSLNRVRGTDQVEAGGVFQVRRVGYRDAEFLFRGWNTTSGRNSTRLVTVEQGTDVDIQNAIVKKMIEIIREEKTDNFIWESHRLGKQVSLSARPQDSVELQQFLIQEFFPDYAAAARR